MTGFSTGRVVKISVRLIFVEKDFLLGMFSRELNFGGAYYWREFCVSKGVCLDNKNISKNDENRLKQLKTTNPNSRWADIRRGFLSKGYLRLRFGELIFGRACFWRGLLSEIYGIYNSCFIARC